MLRNALHLVIFLAGLVAALWIGIGYIGSHAVGATVAFVIAACYLAGGMELLRYRRSSTALAQALDDPAAATDLPAWLQRLPAELRSAVRLRVDGERVALPAPALTPYLVGLLVLLGMLGTLLGMMATLRGTGIALESATDLQAIRGSLASPVEGLAVAFGTSIAGVATSAMLGLLSSLLRRERLAVTQALDLRIATDLHRHTQAWQRAETLRLLQLQSDVMPALVDRLQVLVDDVRQASNNSHEQLQARQAAFHAHGEASQAQLATSLEQSLQRGVEAGALAIGGALAPMLRSTLDGLAAESARTQASITDAVQQQVTGLQQGFERASATAGNAWSSALASQREANAELVDALRTMLQQSAATQQQGAAELVDSIGQRLQASNEVLAANWQAITRQQQDAHAALAEHNAQSWQHAAAGHRQQAEALLARLEAGNTQLQERIGEGDARRMAAWSQAFTALADNAGAQWRRDSEEVAQRQQDICDALERAAARMGTEAQAHASSTIAEIGRLVDAAAEAPRAAAEVVAELRERLSDSLLRDTALLDERTQLLGTLGTLMDAINVASTQQRVAVDGLIEQAGALLERTGAQFGQQVQANAEVMDGLATQLASGAGHVTALAQGLEGAVTTFSTSSDGLSGHLQQLAGALDASLQRSDEQLAYYVAQAREVVDLSLLSQKQVIDELKQLSATAGKA